LKKPTEINGIAFLILIIVINGRHYWSLSQITAVELFPRYVTKVKNKQTIMIAAFLIMLTRRLMIQFCPLRRDTFKVFGLLIRFVSLTTGAW
jgi:hypothetical protein